jgi:hypothetical protein
MHRRNRIVVVESDSEEIDRLAEGWRLSPDLEDDHDQSIAVAKYHLPADDSHETSMSVRIPIPNGAQCLDLGHQARPRIPAQLARRQPCQHGIGSAMQDDQFAKLEDSGAAAGYAGEETSQEFRDMESTKVQEGALSRAHGWQVETIECNWNYQDYKHQQHRRWMRHTSHQPLNTRGYDSDCTEAVETRAL